MMNNDFQASAQRHGINLRHSTTNPGTGDCAFESLIQNINDRPCFREKFTMSINYYRRIFVTWPTELRTQTSTI